MTFLSIDGHLLTCFDRIFVAPALQTSRMRMQMRSCRSKQWDLLGLGTVGVGVEERIDAAVAAQSDR